jgi:hypothetical protein
MPGICGLHRIHAERSDRIGELPPVWPPGCSLRAHLRWHMLWKLGPFPVASASLQESTRWVESWHAAWILDLGRCRRSAFSLIWPRCRKTLKGDSWWLSRNSPIRVAWGTMRARFASCDGHS